MIALDLCQPHYQVLLIMYQYDKNCESKCDFIGFKNNKLHYKCNECKKRQLKPINWLIKKFLNIYKFCNGDINKFILLLRKGFYAYEYMDS